MSVQLELALDRAKIVVGEDVGFRITLRNAGSTPAAVRDPARDEEWPKLEVLEPSGFRVAHAGRGGRERTAGHEFLPPPFPEHVTLGPGDAASGEERLLSWIEPLPVGRYSVRGQLEADGHALRSTGSPLEVEPLTPVAVQLVGPHAGPAELAYALVTHAEADGTRTLLSWLHQLDFEGHVRFAAVQRLGAVVGEPVGSVSRAGIPYPGQWVAWTDGDGIEGFYHLQGRPIARLLGTLASPARIVGPVLTELEGCDGSAPPRAEVLLHAPGRAFVALVAPDGSVTEGASWALDGELEWGHATLPESNVREAFLALSRPTGLEVVRLRWDADQRPEKPASIAKRAPARVLAGDLSLGGDGGSHGALVTRTVPDGKRPDEPDRYELVRFGVDPTGAPGASATVLGTDPPRDFVRALVAVRSDGASQIVLQSVGGPWWTSSGGPATRVGDLDGEPLALRFWGPRPRLLCATPLGPAWRGIGP